MDIVLKGYHTRMPGSILTSEDKEGVPRGVASVTSAHYPVVLVMVNGTRLLQLGGELTVLFCMGIHLLLPALGLSYRQYGP